MGAEHARDTRGDWASVEPSKKDGDWVNLGQSRDAGRTTQRPAVLTTGPNAELFGPMAALIHDAGNGAGQGGFGGVFASKNLKAVSVIGTGGVDIADPNALMEARMWSNGYAFGGHHDDPVDYVGLSSFSCTPGRPLSTIQDNPEGTKSRPQGCVGCIRNCRGRTDTGKGNESQCVDFFWYDHHDVKRQRTRHRCDPPGGRCDPAGRRERLCRGGSNPVARAAAHPGHPGKGQGDRLRPAVRKVRLRRMGRGVHQQHRPQTDIGKEICKGVAQAAEKWGRLEMDTASGLLPLQEYGLPHHYDARTEVEWGYGSLIGERDINEHDFNWHVYWTPTINGLFGLEPPVSAERLSEIFAKKTAPFNDPMMINYSDEGIYSEAMAKTVAWHRHYTRFYKQSMGFCDWAWADYVNPMALTTGLSPEGEIKFIERRHRLRPDLRGRMEGGAGSGTSTSAIWPPGAPSRGREGALSTSTPPVHSPVRPRTKLPTPAVVRRQRGGPTRAWPVAFSTARWPKTGRLCS